MITIDNSKLSIGRMKQLIELFDAGILVEGHDKKKPIRKNLPVKSIPEDKLRCIKCKRFHVIKNGKRYNKMEIKQKYLCLDCNTKFVKDSTRFKFPKYIREYIQVMDKSSRKIAKDIFDKFGCKISHATVVRIKNRDFKVDKNG